MSTLAYYSTLVKKESLMDRIHLDAEELASIANDLVCEIKVASVASKNRNIEEALSAIEKAQQLIQIVDAMLGNVKNNTQAYVTSLGQQQEQNVKEEPKQEEQKQTQFATPSAPPVDEKQLANVLDAIKSLKEMKESLVK